MSGARLLFDNKKLGERTLEGARIGSIMEEVEIHAQDAFEAPTEMRASFARPSSELTLIDPLELGLPYDSRYRDTLELEWSLCVDLLNCRQVLIPSACLMGERIANASPRVECLVMGTSDLAKELDCTHTRERLPMITSLGLCMLAARAYGLTILDGVYLDLGDAEGFVYACHQGADLGFDGKTLIHPNQVGPCNEVFTPRPEDVEWSRRIIAAHTEAAAKGEGVAVVDGKLIENLHVESAERLVAMAEAIEKMERDAAAAV